MAKPLRFMQISKTIRYISEIPIDLQKLLELYSSVKWTRYANCPEKLWETIEKQGC